MTMVADQAQQLRAMVADDASQPARTAARVIAVASGKGGVGKTNVSVNLAVSLAMMNRRVVLLDADLGTANADVLCNVSPLYNLAHVVAGRRSLSEVMVESPGGFVLIPGASGLARMASMSDASRQRLLDQLYRLEVAADVILIDTGAGVSQNVLGFAASADQLLVVTTPEPTAVTDAYALVKTAWRQRPEFDASLLVNMVRDDHEARGVYERLAAVGRQFLKLDINYAGCIPTDASVTDAVRLRSPFALNRRGKACEAVMRLAHRLDRHATDAPRPGFIKRLSGWLTGSP